MTHLLTPPPELVRQWMERTSYDEHTWFYESYIAEQAAKWGWDQREPEIQADVDAELEACVQTLKDQGWYNVADDLRAARRPKAPSLKEQALSDLKNVYNADMIDDTTFENIRRALEALSDE